MIKANIATTKNHLSRLLRRVKRGETVVITERDRPVARLEPYIAAAPAAGAAPADAITLSRLYESGVLSPPKASHWDVPAFLASLPRSAPLPPQHGLTSAVLADREESA